MSPLECLRMSWSPKELILAGYAAESWEDQNEVSDRDGLLNPVPGLIVL